MAEPDSSLRYSRADGQLDFAVVAETEQSRAISKLVSAPQMILSSAVGNGLYADGARYQDSFSCSSSRDS